MKHFVQPCITLLCDRSSQVRQQAEQLTEKIIAEIRTEPFEQGLKDLKPALKDQVGSILSKYGVECDVEQRKKQGKTPKQKLEKAYAGDNRRLNRIMTTKDLQNTSTDSHLNNSTHEYKSRTPKKGVGQEKRSNQKVLPSELSQGNTPNYDLKCHVKPVFLEGSMLATQVSVRELKQLRQDFDPWIQETFGELATNETISDLRICFKP